MTALTRGLILASVQVAMVCGVAAKYQVDRERLPREWMRAAPYDPNLPIRGRYVRLRLPDYTGPSAGEPVAFFIPEHVPDPSRRPAGEELWVEVSLPKSGPPRPVRLGVKKDGVLSPLPF